MECSPMARCVTPPDPLEQARLVHSVMDPKLENKDDWFVVSLRWWDLWKAYTCFDSPSRFGDDGQQDEGDEMKRTTSGMTKGAMPPEIDNSDLCMGLDSTRLQKGLMERRDFILLHKAAWKLIYSWYNGGPVLKRRVISVSTGSSTELRVELYPYWLSVLQVDAGGMVNKESKMELICSRCMTVQDVLVELCLCLELKDDSNESVRLWHRPDPEVDQTDTDALDGWEQLTPPSATLEELSVVDGASLLLEQPNVTYVTPAYSSTAEAKTTWPFFHRLRVEYKEQHYKKPSDPSVTLEVNDKIDASAVGKKREFNGTNNLC